MNTGNSKTSEPHRFKLGLTDKLHENENIFLITSLESSLFYYSGAYILVTRNITVEILLKYYRNITKVAFKNCAPFRKCRTVIFFLYNFC